ncbi:MAG: ECF transporter S component [Bacilli bacterium]|nr:ECF transporter S component [Bacilli bacterium]
MEKRRFFNTRMIATVGVLTAIEIVLQVIGNYVAPGGFTSLNFSLIIISLGAILYGPVVGGFLGFVSGTMTILAPSTLSYFYSISPLGTILTCLLKTTLAGVLAGLIMMIFKKYDKKTAGSIVASILVPIINTGVFAIFCLVFFMDRLTEINPNNIASALFLGMIGFNFIFEILTTSIVTPSLTKIMEHVSTNKED